MHRPASKNAPQIETLDPITGELFKARTENHFEKNDGVPHAPPVDMPRRTLRQRVEDLLYRGGMVPPLTHDGSTDDDFDIDDPIETPDPMTAAEKNYALAEGFRELRSRPPAAAETPQPSPAPNPPPAGPNAPAASAAPAPSPSAPPTPGT